MSESTQHLGPMDRRTILGAGLLGAAGIAGRASAGPLDPPTGPVGPTGRTTDELFAAAAQGARLLSSLPSNSSGYRYISEPGHYILDENINIDSTSVSAIIYVVASDVVIDLNGHSIKSKAASTYGVGMFGSNSGLTVRNGTIDCLGGGIGASSRPYCRAERLVIRNATSTVTTGGPYGVGMVLGDEAVVTDCVVSNSRSSAYLLANNANLKRCTATDNAVFSAISTGSGASLEDCRSVRAAASGILVGDNSSLLRCVSVDAGENGILTGSSCTIERCIASGAKTGSGIRTGVNCIVSGCTSRLNKIYGVNSGEQNIIENCAINANYSGILVGNTGLCRGNLVDFHRSAGARGIVTMSNCLVEDNIVTRSFYGIHCAGTRNLYRRNFLRVFEPAGNSYETIGNNSVPLMSLTDFGIVGSSTPDANIVE